MGERAIRFTAVIRAGTPEDGERVREIAHAAKRYWGYEAKVVADWAAGLDFTSASFAKREVYVAEADDEVVAWAGLILDGETSVLDDLWVDPPWIGRGVGSQLFVHSVQRARELGAKRLEWGAEPRAVGFYEKMGGRWVRDHTTVWGRQAPWMGLDLEERVAK